MNLTTPQLSKRLNVSAGTLSNWRVQGRGPRFVKFGRKVLYPLAEVEAFERQALRQNTAREKA